MLEHTYPGPAGTDEYLRWISGGVCASPFSHHSSADVARNLLTNSRSLADGAGVDTTQATLRRFVLAMVRHPEIQKKAQEEIYNVTEGRRLPTFEE